MTTRATLAIIIATATLLATLGVSCNTLVCGTITLARAMRRAGLLNEPEGWVGRRVAQAVDPSYMD